MTNHRERTESGVGLIESELGASTRSLLRAAREGDQPSAADRARVRQALAVALAAGAAGAAGATTAGASTAAGGTAATAAAGKAAVGLGSAGAAGVGTTAAATTAAAGAVTTAAAGTAATTAGGLATAGLLTKVAVAVVAIGVGSGAVMATGRLWTARTEPAVVAPAASEAAVDAASEHAGVHAAARSAARGAATGIAPAVGTVDEATGAAAIDTIETPVAVPMADVEAPAESPRAIAAPSIAAPALESPAARPRRAAAPAPSASTEDEASVAEETLLIARAQRRGAAASERLEAIDAYDARFPHGQMVEERNRAERRAIGDLCAEGEAAVQAFLATHPSGASASHVRAHCDAE